MRRISVFDRAAALAVGCLVICNPLLSICLGDGPSDNIPTNVRQIPPPGIELPAVVGYELRVIVDEIREAVIASNGRESDKAEVEVFARAIELAIQQATFYGEAEFGHARYLANIALQRASSLRILPNQNGVPQWLRDELTLSTADKPDASSSDSRLIVGGFRSEIDGSIQPYGLVVPRSFNPTDSTPLRLDVWLHGRGEKNLELQFLHQRSKQVGEIAPENTIVLHPFGRYSNAFKFAGEIDVLEAIEHVKTLFPIDENRISIRGFSMGGAGCWQLAVHYPALWMAATPGAGFCETREFLQDFQQELFQPTDYQESLLHWYDCPDWGNNLRYLPTIAYSGELDKQKQAGDLMKRTLHQHGIDLPHLIGPQTAHKLHPDAKLEIERRLTEINQSGRNSVPRKIDFSTYTLRYADSDWVHIDGLEKHWLPARVQAESEPAMLRVTTQNVSHLVLGPISSDSLGSIRSLVIDGRELALDAVAGVGLPKTSLRKANEQWSIVEAENTDASLRKRPGLQGPIDDAFLSPFLFVSPEQIDTPSVVDRWVKSEYDHATKQWQEHFRGAVNSKSVVELSLTDKQTKNLILFGTPTSNPLIAEVLKTMPLAWTNNVVARHPTQAVRHSPETTAVIAVYPSPYSPKLYVVINSGFTFREYAYLNNARQIPMLPDWAIVDVSEGANSQTPGKVLEAGFFDESWQ